VTDLSIVRMDWPAFTLLPASISTFFIEAFIGLVMICSNSDKISPVASMVFSMLRIFTIPVNNLLLMFPSITIPDG